MTATSQPRPGRARDAEATRADLLRAARRRFSAFGYERTTSRDIANEAGVNVSLIYRYFGSKEQLFEVVLEETADLFGRLQGRTIENLIDDFVDGLDGRKHPLLVLLRDTDDDSRTTQLRHQTFGAVISYLAGEITRNDPSLTPQTARNRAGLLFSMFAGVVTLRAGIPQDPFCQADAEDLRAELTRIAAVVVQGRPPA